MELNELLKFIDLEDERLRNIFAHGDDKEKQMLRRVAKLTEEVGELSNAILAFNSLQRPEKLNSYNENNLSEEIADVIITTLLLAKSADVVVVDALKNKVEKINKRYG